MIIYYDDYYDQESADNAETVEQIVDIAKGLLGERVKTRISDLERTVQELTAELEKYTDFEKREHELLMSISHLERDVKREYDRAMEDMRKAKLDALLPLENGWALSMHTDYIRPKCEKCDDNRRIHFKSPRGFDLTEECECAKKHSVYKVNEAPVVSFVFNYNGSENNFKKPSRYYKRTAGTSFGEEETFENALGGNKIWVYKDFADPSKVIGNHNNYYDFVFETKEDAQRYADWLNEKQAEKEKKGGNV